MRSGVVRECHLQFGPLQLTLCFWVEYANISNKNVLLTEAKGVYTRWWIWRLIYCFETRITSVA